VVTTRDFKISKDGKFLEGGSSLERRNNYYYYELELGLTLSGTLPDYYIEKKEINLGAKVFLPLLDVVLPVVCSCEFSLEGELIDVSISVYLIDRKIKSKLVSVAVTSCLNPLTLNQYLKNIVDDGVLVKGFNAELERWN
jgi:hypothetical protein